MLLLRHFANMFFFLQSFLVQEWWIWVSRSSLLFVIMPDPKWPTYQRSNFAILLNNSRTLWPIDVKFSGMMDMGKTPDVPYWFVMMHDPKWPTYQRSKGQISLFYLITLERSGWLTSNCQEWWISVRRWSILICDDRRLWPIDFQFSGVMDI